MFLDFDLATATYRTGNYIIRSYTCQQHILYGNLNHSVWGILHEHV